MIVRQSRDAALAVGIGFATLKQCLQTGLVKLNHHEPCTCEILQLTRIEDPVLSREIYMVNDQ